MIDMDIFRTLSMPVQSPDEWLYYLEFVRTYFLNREISNPIIVEIGIQSNLQKPFYLWLLGAEHIGIDISDRYSKPDILGDALAPETYDALCARLVGRQINLLFIDASQKYEDVRSYFRLYAPLVSDIVVLHPIMTTAAHPDGTRRLWQELFADRRKDYNFITIYSHVGKDDPCHRYQYGTGFLIKRRSR